MIKANPTTSLIVGPVSSNERTTLYRPTPTTFNALQLIYNKLITSYHIISLFILWPTAKQNNDKKHQDTEIT